MSENISHARGKQTDAVCKRASYMVGSLARHIDNQFSKNVGGNEMKIGHGMDTEFSRVQRFLLQYQVCHVI